MLKPALMSIKVLEIPLAHLPESHVVCVCECVGVDVHVYWEIVATQITDVFADF